MKAAFLYQFALFTDWPDARGPAEQGALLVGVVGGEEFADQVSRTLVGKSVKGAPVAVVSLRDARDMSACHVVFVGSALPERFPWRELQSEPVLTVSDIDDFAERGGMIELYVENSKMRFAINRAAVEKAGLKMSSKLLALASSTEPAGSGPAAGLKR